MKKQSYQKQVTLSKQRSALKAAAKAMQASVKKPQAPETTIEKPLGFWAALWRWIRTPLKVDSNSRPWLITLALLESLLVCRFAYYDVKLSASLSFEHGLTLGCLLVATVTCGARARLTVGLRLTQIVCLILAYGLISSDFVGLAPYCLPHLRLTTALILSNAVALPIHALFGYSWRSIVHTRRATLGVWAKRTWVRVDEEPAYYEVEYYRSYSLLVINLSLLSLVANVWMVAFLVLAIAFNAVRALVIGALHLRRQSSLSTFLPWVTVYFFEARTVPAVKVMMSKVFGTYVHADDSRKLAHAAVTRSTLVFRSTIVLIIIVSACYPYVL